MAEAGKINGQRKGMTFRIGNGSGKTYEEIRRQAVRITEALGSQARGGAAEHYPGETNFWAGAATPRGKQVSIIAGRYLENVRNATGLPLEFDTRDRRANTKVPRRIYMRRNRNWE